MTLLKLGAGVEHLTSSDEGSNDDEDFDLGVDINEPSVDSVQVLLNVISKSVGFLFRIGIFVRNSGQVDRFQRALKKSEPIPAWVE